MSATSLSKSFVHWLRVGAYVSVITVAACGGGGDTSAGSSADNADDGSSVAQTDGNMPASAFNSSNSFLAWVKDFANPDQESGEPVRIAKPNGSGSAAVAADETSEPVRLR
ncbi:MAG: hypothetical protein ACRBC3_10915 [Burkholderiaceae bacterium]